LTERQLYANEMLEDASAPVAAVRQARVDGDDFRARLGKFAGASVTMVVAGTRFFGLFGKKVLSSSASQEDFQGKSVV
jgi:hypothetical protein